MESSLSAWRGAIAATGTMTVKLLRLLVTLDFHWRADDGTILPFRVFLLPLLHVCDSPHQGSTNYIYIYLSSGSIVCKLTECVPYTHITYIKSVGILTIMILSGQQGQMTRRIEATEWRRTLQCTAPTVYRRHSRLAVRVDPLA
eukprot:GHVU01011516.1.p1 GENE.GHVU01011516.1~~GHVU01011516.1.p1  ORF type:complete len:144 (+),score=8.27 GHVU01011516.1:540-971(+)